jgi:membrane-bound lytic murein transglycosylase D
MAKSNRNLLVAGLIAITGSSMGAWAVATHPEGAEPAPMEEMLTDRSAGTESAWDLPVTRNDRVEKWIGFLAGGNADKTRLYLERSGKYAPFIREQLAARGMPEDLVYLAFIESGFSPKAYSRAAASGMWQFIEETGERYGLEVNQYVDERRDPIESTRAAMDYLTELHDRFGSWYLAAAAYNSGENRVARVLRERVGGRTGDDELFWRIAAHLPRETRDYVPLMLAAGHIGKNPEEFGFDSVNYQHPLAFDTAWVPGQSTLALVAQASGVEESAIRDLNPHLIRGVTPPGRAWSVRVPEGSLVSFAVNFPPLYRSEVAREKTRVTLAKASVRKHRVRSGETLTHIAKRYGVSVSALTASNTDVSARRLKPGQTLSIPGAVAAKRINATAGTVRFHKVSRGENLSLIAKRYQSSVRRLQSLNGLGRSSQIQPGQKLRVI